VGLPDELFDFIRERLNCKWRNAKVCSILIVKVVGSDWV